ncbi:hypothetical protein [Phaffia rhodozyma]|uniref:Uncharacterized protein n=1 Tax=Phaffia rhodozyma TaxID=264483 RepID=A0A0F7SMB5_PHARH|nr:hypothetical protein [Phaffia rhodozyma]
MLVDLLLIALLSSICLASPPATSATFSSTSLIIINNILDYPTGLVGAARHGRLSEYLPDVCRSPCSNYTDWEASCLVDMSHSECGLKFCTRPMALSYYSCVNCMLYVKDPTLFSPRRYVSLETQSNIIQMSCRGFGRSTGPLIELASYLQIGMNTNNVTDFKPPDVRAIAVTVSSARSEWGSRSRSRLGMVGIGIGVLGWSLL